MKFHEISKTIKLMKFMEILDFCDSGRPETLIFLRNYWCFCNIMNSMEFPFFSQKWKFHDCPLLELVSRISIKNTLFLKKRAHGAQDHPKCIVFHWFKQHSRQWDAPVRKHELCTKSKKFFCGFREKMEKFMKIIKNNNFHVFGHVKTPSIP